MTTELLTSKEQLHALQSEIQGLSERCTALRRALVNVTREFDLPKGNMARVMSEARGLLSTLGPASETFAGRGPDDAEFGTV